MESNIEVFDKCTAVIFAKLYENFPVPVELEYTSMPESVVTEEDDFDSVSDKLVIYEETIKWLISAGYINGQQIDNLKAYDVVLSVKGLEVLKLPATLQKSGPSFGESLVSALKSGARDAAKNAAKRALTQGVGIIASNV